MRPRKGDRGTYQSPRNGLVGFTIHHVDDNLCWATYDHYANQEPQPFIWRFKDGLNTLHDWPRKSEDAS